MRSGVALTDEDREPWIRSLNSAVRNWIADKREMVVACSALRGWNRNALRESVPGPEIHSLRIPYGNL